MYSEEWNMIIGDLGFFSFLPLFDFLVRSRPAAAARSLFPRLSLVPFKGVMFFFQPSSFVCFAYCFLNRLRSWRILRVDLRRPLFRVNPPCHVAARPARTLLPNNGVLRIQGPQPTPTPPAFRGSVPRPLPHGLNKFPGPCY